MTAQLTLEYRQGIEGDRASIARVYDREDRVGEAVLVAGCGAVCELASGHARLHHRLKVAHHTRQLVRVHPASRALEDAHAAAIACRDGLVEIATPESSE